MNYKNGWLTRVRLPLVSRVRVTCRHEPAGHPNPLPRIDVSFNGYRGHHHALEIVIVRSPRRRKPAMRRYVQVTLLRRNGGSQ